MARTPIITPADLRDKYAFGFTQSQTDDAFYANFIDGATSACYHFLDVDDLASTARVEFFDGGSKKLVLSHTPVISVIGVYADPERGYTTALASSKYRIDFTSGVLVLYDDALDADLQDAIKVSYTSGYATIPEDIKYAVALTVQLWARTLQSSQAGVISRTVDGGTESLDQSIPPLAVQKYLASYRRNLVR